MKKLFRPILTILSALFLSCHSETDRACLVIDLQNPIRRTIALSELFDSIEYVRLETSDKCLIDESSSTFYLTDEYIVCTQFKNLTALLFDRGTGNFIRQIGRRGKGPGEYSLLISRRAFDEKERILYFDRNREWMGVQIETGAITSVIKPADFETALNERYKFFPISGFFRLDSVRYIGFVNNISGKDSVKLVIFNKEGRVLRTFPNYQHYDKRKHNSVEIYGGHFYRQGKAIRFKENRFNDTVFNVTYDAVSPYIVFSAGDKKIPYALREQDGFDIKNFIIPALTGENMRHILFEYSYQGTGFYGYYDKTTRQTFVCEGKGEAFVNDLAATGNMPRFKPVSMNERGACFAILLPEEAIDSPVINLFPDIREDDNPILIIASNKP